MTAQIPLQTKKLYEQDFQLWLEKTIQSLREGKLLEVDYENLLGELEDMGRSERNALKSKLMPFFKYEC